MPEPLSFRPNWTFPPEGAASATQAAAAATLLSSVPPYCRSKRTCTLTLSAHHCHHCHSYPHVLVKPPSPHFIPSVVMMTTKKTTHHHNYYHLLPPPRRFHHSLGRLPLTGRSSETPPDHWDDSFIRDLLTYCCCQGSPHPGGKYPPRLRRPRQDQKLPPSTLISQVSLPPLKKRVGMAAPTAILTLTNRFWRRGKGTAPLPPPLPPLLPYYVTPTPSLTN